MSGLCMGGDELDAPLPRYPSSTFPQSSRIFEIIRHVSKSQNHSSDHTTEFNFYHQIGARRREEGGGRRRSIRQRVVEGQEMRR